MTIDHERPEDEWHASGAAALLTVIGLIQVKTQGGCGSGSVTCPICRAGTLTYTAQALEPAGAQARRAIAARCSTSGCIAVSYS
jgi:hypothetical protein